MAARSRARPRDMPAWRRRRARALDARMFRLGGLRGFSSWRACNSLRGGGAFGLLRRGHGLVRLRAENRISPRLDQKAALGKRRAIAIFGHCLRASRQRRGGIARGRRSRRLRRHALSNRRGGIVLRDVSRLRRRCRFNGLCGSGGSRRAGKSERGYERQGVPGKPERAEQHHARGKQHRRPPPCPPVCHHGIERWTISQGDKISWNDALLTKRLESVAVPSFAKVAALCNDTQTRCWRWRSIAGQATCLGRMQPIPDAPYD
jgi:hypothetical protein